MKFWLTDKIIIKEALIYSAIYIIRVRQGHTIIQLRKWKIVMYDITCISQIATCVHKRQGIVFHVNRQLLKFMFRVHKFILTVQGVACSHERQLLAENSG